MTLKMKDVVTLVVDGCLDVTAFAAVGNLSGRLVNHLAKQGSLSGIFSRLESANLQSATYCCALFIAIDRLATGVLRHQFSVPDFEIVKPTFSAIRIVLSGIAAIELTNYLAPTINMAKIDYQSATAILATAFLIYSTLQLAIYMYNQRP